MLSITAVLTGDPSSRQRALLVLFLSRQSSGRINTLNTGTEIFQCTRHFPDHSRRCSQHWIGKGLFPFYFMLVLLKCTWFMSTELHQLIVNLFHSYLGKHLLCTVHKWFRGVLLSCLNADINFTCNAVIQNTLSCFLTTRSCLVKQFVPCVNGSSAALTAARPAAGGRHAWPQQLVWQLVSPRLWDVNAVGNPQM